ncbi:MAG: hypothetical protein HZB77_14755 [Chloroflexi bacterium]|nr:hypothetical protein [Chloroflexota bacterium]
MLRLIHFTLLTFFIALTFHADVRVIADIPTQVDVRVSGRQFDFVTWTLDALGVKVSQSISSEQNYMSVDQRKRIVLEYFDQMNRMLKMRGQIDEIFTDPKQTDPVAASRDLRAQLDQTRARLDKLQPLAEGILQEQISAILTEEGFTTGGQLLPPISIHISALPGYLIVSPRDRIERIAYSMVEPGLSADDKVALESKIEKELNVSAIIEPIGGLGSYPAMVYETANLNYIAEVGAHEWSHNYLTLRPLGINYDNSPQLRTINETTATIFGQEIGQKVIARYYPERVPPPTPTPSPRPTRTPGPAPTRAPTPTRDPNVFNFNLEMRETRVTVDQLLLEGKIEQAEAYMEERRQFFWTKGYQIRKLNQAYFAFHGSYNAGPGAGGQDPVGPAVVEFRKRSPTLKSFLDSMSWMTSFEELQKAIK